MIRSCNYRKRNGLEENNFLESRRAGRLHEAGRKALRSGRGKAVAQLPAAHRRSPPRPRLSGFARLHSYERRSGIRAVPAALHSRYSGRETGRRGAHRKLCHDPERSHRETTRRSHATPTNRVGKANAGHFRKPPRRNSAAAPAARRGIYCVRSCDGILRAPGGEGIVRTRAARRRGQ